MNIVPIIVVYNKSLEESSTLSFLKDNRLFKDVVVYDNSTQINDNVMFAEDNGWHYITNKQNDGISVAYNNSIQYILLHEIKCDYILMLDDDADLTVDFFNEAIPMVKKEEYEIYVPIIRCNGSIMSPAVINSFGRIRKIKDLSEIGRRNLTAINNCSFIKLSTARDVKYNERLFLDYVDHDFFRRVREQDGEIKVMNLVINHNMSVDDSSVSKEARLFRFGIYKKDLRTFYKRNVLTRLFYRLHILRMSVRYTIQYKSLDFIRGKKG